MNGRNGPETDRRLDELTSRLDAAAARIIDLENRAQQASERQDASDARQDAYDTRADASDARQDAGDQRAAEHETRMTSIEERLDIDREIILQLQADGLVSREHATNLEAALGSSRLIGAAVGIIMAFYGVPETNAFAILRQASMDTNRKLRVVAEDVVETGALPEAPEPSRPHRLGETLASIEERLGSHG